MGRNAGGVVIDGNKAEKGITERGYTEKMMNNTQIKLIERKGLNMQRKMLSEYEP